MCLSLIRGWFLGRKEKPKTTGGILTVTAEGDIPMIEVTANSGTFRLSQDGERWASYPSGYRLLDFNSENKLFLCGMDAKGELVFDADSVKIEGDLMWLIDYENGSDTVPSGGFENLFSAVSIPMELTCLATNASSDSFTNWLNSDSTGILHRPAVKNFPDSYYNLPSGWTIVDA